MVCLPSLNGPVADLRDIVERRERNSTPGQEILRLQLKRRSGFIQALGLRSMSIADRIDFEPFEPRHVAGAARLAHELDWPSYADPEIARAAFSAPGSITWVAMLDEKLIGLAHLLTNGVVHAHLSLVGVHLEHRRMGVAKRLIEEAFAESGAKWLDLWAEHEAEDFYRSFRHSEHVGFRIYPRKPTPDD
jgi:ribosomal protein S18 acetylase RimI-like enzyme